MAKVFQTTGFLFVFAPFAGNSPENPERRKNAEELLSLWGHNQPYQEPESPGEMDNPEDNGHEHQQPEA
jgi:hypothetical protein